VAKNNFTGFIINIGGEIMNKINAVNASVSFRGLAVSGIVSGKNVKKLGDFASRYENINFIKDLEKDFGVDAVLDKDITQMSFSHKQFGNLDIGSYPLENVFQNVTVIMKDLKSALKFAEKNQEKELAARANIIRGC